MSALHLSVIVPAYNEGARIDPMLARLHEWASTSPFSVEVVVVDDGSTDDTVERASVWGTDRWKVLSLDRNFGKGRAVREGMLAATGAWRAFLDADGATDPGQLDVLLRHDAAVVIGSVATATSRIASPQWRVRSGLGQVGNRIIQHLVLPGIDDTQRGCKLFRGDVAEQVFGRCEIDGWGFDVEVLGLARSLGHEPLEIGVEWTHQPAGHVRPWHFLTTLVDVIRVRRRIGRQPPVRQPSHGPDRGTDR